MKKQHILHKKYGIMDYMSKQTIIPIVKFLEKLFVLPNGKLIQLYESQKRVLEAAFSPDKDGKLKYRTIVYSCPKKCMADGERIWTRDGLFEAIESYVGRQIKVWSYTRKGFIDTYAKVSANGSEKCIRVVTKSGIDAIRTTNEPFFVYPGAWKKASELVVGDSIGVPSFIPEPKNTICLDQAQVAFVAIVLSSSRILRDMLVFDKLDLHLSCLLDDICIQNNIKIRYLQTMDREISMIKFSDTYTVFGDSDIAGILSSVPKWIFLGDTKSITTFIAYFMLSGMNNCDGSTSIDIKSKYLCDDIVALMNRIALHPDIRYISNNDTYQIRLPGNNKPDSYVMWDTVDIIEDVGDRETFAVTVPKYENFLSKNIAHNSGKSQTAACVASWYTFAGMAELNDEIYCLANDQEQARRVYEALRRSIEMCPAIKAECVKIHDRLILTRNGTSIIPIANDYAGAAGANPSMSLWDELWAFTSESDRRLWEEMTPVPTRRNSFRFISTYAGFCFRSDRRISVLTDNGWVQYSDVRIGDNVASFNSRNEFEFTQVTGVYDDNYNGPMVKISANMFDIDVTPNHSMYVSTDVGVEKTYWSKYTAGSLVDEENVAIKSFCKNNPGGIRTNFANNKLVDGEKQCFLIGHILRSGVIMIDKNSGKRIICFQKKSSSISFCKLVRLLKTLDATYVHAGNCIRMTDENLLSQILHETENEFVLPKTILSSNARDLGVLLHAACSDIVETSYGAKLHYVVRKDVSDILSTIAPMCGMRVYQNSSSNGACYITLDPRHFYWSNKSGRTISEYTYSGPIWCLTTRNGNFLVDYDGTHFFTGNSGESRLLESIYENVVHDEFRLDLGKSYDYVEEKETDIPVYERGSTFCYWDHGHRSPMQTKKYLDEQMEEPSFRQSAFRRQHLNEWVESEEGMDMSQWDACVRIGESLDYKTALMADVNTSIAIGVDASTVKDRSAVVSVFKKDGRLWLGPRQWWEPTQQNPMNFENTLEKYIIDLSNRFNVVKVYYDPWQFERSASVLREHGVNMVKYPQTQPNTITMTVHLIDIIREGKLVMYRDEALRKEASMVSIKTVVGRGQRFTKTRSNKKIDSIIALSMAALAAERFATDLSDFSNQFMFLSRDR